MLSLFGCRVSNVLEFELRNMLKNFSDNFFLYNFLCTFFSWQYSLYKLLLQQASMCCNTLGICLLFRLDGRFLSKENHSSLILNMHLMAILPPAGNSLHNLPCDKRSSSSRLVPEKRLLHSDRALLHGHPGLRLQHRRDARHHCDGCPLQHRGQLDIWDLVHILAASWWERDNTSPTGKLNKEKLLVLASDMIVVDARC